MKEFAKRTKQLMRENGISQKELAALSGISESSISRYLSGELEPRMDILSNIAHALGASTSFLLGEDVPIANKQTPFAETISVVTRNKAKLTDQEKAELVKILFGGK